jgi:hypothetical protein
VTETRNSSDHNRVVTALATALANWEQWKRDKTLLTAYPPEDSVVAPLVAAIEECEAFKPVQGCSLFSGNSGVILHARALAPEVLYRAERTSNSDAAHWLIRMLGTRHANGLFIGAIWGLSIDREVEIAQGMMLVPFDNLFESAMKRRITNQASAWATAVWISQRYFDVPGSALIRKVGDFPYIGALDKSVQTLEKLEDEAKAPLSFLQARAAGQPLAVASWFEYEDTDLDFNAQENYFSWFLPEVVPHIRAHVVVDTGALKRDADALWNLPDKLRSKLLRSMERFILSQCRRQTGDRALDLVIAFEIAVSGGKGDNAPVNWKIGVRTAQIIGGTLQQRQETRRILSALCGFRNDIVHGGSLKDGDQQKLENSLARSTSIYRTLLASFLSLGSVPDWPSLELEPRTRN